MTSKRITGFVPSDVKEALTQEAARRDVSLSKAVEVAVIHWLTVTGRYPKRTYSPDKGSK